MTYDPYADNYTRSREQRPQPERGRDDDSIFGFARSRETWRRDAVGRGRNDRWSGQEHEPGRYRAERGYRDRDRWQDREARRDRERAGPVYGPDDYRDGLPIDETSHLIASNKVEGTAVYGREGDRLGTIYNFMVDKISGHVEYAVMAYGGFLGMGARYYPLPWRVLTYDTREGGYHINLSDEDLRDAPSFDRATEPRFDRRYGSYVDRYYGLF